MDGTVDRFPQALFKDASPRATQINFHPRTREACKGNSSIKGLHTVTSKIIVVGNLGVGKTSLVNRYSRNEFLKDYKPTIGVEYEVKKLGILDTPFHLQVWDTSGEERFKSITNAYYRGSNAILVVFDLTDSLSLHDARTWADEALSNTRTTVPEIFLVGSKKDVIKSGQLKEMRQEAKTVAEEMNAEYWEVSSKSGSNVKELFARISAICFDQAVLRNLENDKKEEKEKVKVGAGSGESGMQTIQLGKQDIARMEPASSKKGCCKSS